MALRDALINAAITLGMETTGRRAFRRFLALAEAPERAQTDALRMILSACRATEQGKRFGLGGVGTVAAFRAAVPIQTYEDIRPAIERQVATGALEIAPERPLMYARSSGTTGRSKYIPVTRAILHQMRNAQRAVAFAQYQPVRTVAGRFVGIGGAKAEELLDDGAPAGATTGLLYETMPSLMRSKYVVPPSAFSIEDYALKYQFIARLLAGAGDVTVFATANPSTLVRLMDVVNQDLAQIVRDVAEGGFSRRSALPPAVARDLGARLKPDRTRAEALGRLLASGRRTEMRDLWPGLYIVVTWLGGGCAAAANAIRGQIPAQTRMVDAGYLASEVLGTIVIDAERGLALPVLSDVFFEFVPVAAWDRGERQTLLLHELTEGEDYQIIITTAAGLLRYHMNDVVRATASIGRTPTLAFIRKGRGVTNITGEKLSEDQVHVAMGTVAGVAFFVVLADTNRSVYRAYLEVAGLPPDAEKIARTLDERLASLNIEYAAKRASARLLPLEVRLLRRGAGDAYHRHCVERKGQREAQIKVLALQTVEECDFDFSSVEIRDATAVTDLR